MVKYGSEAWALRKADEDLLCFPEKLAADCSGYPADRTSNSRLYAKCGSIPLSSAVIRKRLRLVRVRSTNEG